MNALATICAKLIACCLLFAFTTASNVTAQAIVPPEDPSGLADLPMVFNLDTDDVDWEGYTMFPFEGSALERIENPDVSDGNTTDYVLQYVKAGGQPWAGFFYHTDGEIEITDDSRFTLNVWSHTAEVTAMLKLEMRQFPDVETAEMFVNIPVANEWTQLEWDLSGVDRDTPWDRAVIIFDLQGPAGDGSDRFTWFLDDFAFTTGTVSNEGVGEGIQQLATLHPNYPNPVSSATSIAFSMSSPGHAVVEVFDVLGRRVTTLVNETLPAGPHEASFDSSDLPGGTYIYRLQVGDQVWTRKLTVIN